MLIISILGQEVSLQHQYIIILLCSLPFLFLTGAGSLIFWVMGVSICSILLHAAFYNYDKLEVESDEEFVVEYAVVEEV